MPSTAKDLGVEDSFQPDENVRGGSAYLDELLTRYQTTLRWRWQPTTPARTQWTSTTASSLPRDASIRRVCDSRVQSPRTGARAEAKTGSRASQTGGGLRAGSA